MHFSSLTSDELSTVLENLSAKQLFSLSNTSRELRVAARQALNAPRFAERKRWASLGERLLKECQHNGHRIVTEAPELVAFEEKYWRRSEHPVSGIWVPYDFTEKQARAEEASSASVSAVGSSYLRAVAPSRCVVRMTGPLEEDCRHVVPRWVLIAIAPPAARSAHSHPMHPKHTLLRPACHLLVISRVLSLCAGGSCKCCPCGPLEQRRSSRRGCTRCRTGTPAPSLSSCCARR